MEYCKLQLGCLLVLLYIAFVYVKECVKHRKNFKESFFDELLILGVISAGLDAFTTYTVNHADSVAPAVNRIFHTLFLISLDSVIFVLFLYILYITGAFPKKKYMFVLLFLPFCASILLVIKNIGSLSYINGRTTSYAAGVSVQTCFIMAWIYILITIGVFFRRWSYIENHKRTSILTYLLMLAAVTGIQTLFPEMLITSLAITLVILGVYMNQEDPALVKLAHYHSEMIMGFAGLIENRDDSTGGHVKRTSMYVKLIAEELRHRGCYENILTKDYVENLLKAAPMHDIGKISTPDAILQKPGKLTSEEYDIMKQHAANGGKIIKELFVNMGNDEYCQMAYEVARFHHEKWNGKGYPEGRKEKDIPLCARIMAVADVFDAVSEKRCYRDAMPLEECFEIIRQGSGADFDPQIADAFLCIEDKVKQVHDSFADSKYLP